MFTTEKQIQDRLNTLKDKYFTALNKNNLNLRFANKIISIRSSFLRMILLMDLLSLYLLISFFFQIESQPYWVALFFSTSYFIYAVWRDSGSINRIKIDLHGQTIRIYHLNIFRYFALKTFFGYKNIYLFNEVKLFNLTEKYHLKSMYSTNFIKIHLADDAEYIILDIPDKNQAASLTNLLNEALGSDNYRTKN